MQLATIRRILDAYELDVVAIGQSQKGYRNEAIPLLLADRTTLNLILYKSEAGMLTRIRNANKVADFLADAGFPARRTYASRIICLKRGSFIKYAALYNYLPGNTIAWEAYTREHIKCLGKTLSDMHAALRKLPRHDLPDVVQEYRKQLQRMSRYFADPAVDHALREKLGCSIPADQFDILQAVLEAAQGLHDLQPLHMDFVRSNILFSDEVQSVRVSGILDFEKAAWGHPVFDIARTLAFLQVDCKYKTPLQVWKYFLRSGYNKRGSMTYTPQFVTIADGRFDLLQQLLHLFWLHDFYKFLRHNPYESLPANEHFRRTYALLVNYGWLEHRQTHEKMLKY